MTWAALACAILLVACSGGRPPPDMGVPVEPPWDGRCLGRLGDADRLVIWGRRPYLCKDHGKTSGWWFEQVLGEDLDPGTRIDGIVFPDGHVLVRP